ncbi:MAG: hypothetical protein H0W69_04380 [Gemmatimonadaceae bacterium]|nr:hypothetical protein [Gemmatimonadaceae bacterium]
MIRAGAFLFFLPIAAFGQRSVRDTVAKDTAYVIYHDSPIDFPLLFGLRIPIYDRINGLTLPFGPRLTLGEDVLEAEAIVSYRSNLGKFDPSGSIRFAPILDTWIRAEGGRGTFSNDRWIRGDLLNSAASFGVGSDSRNYYRADQVRLSIGRRIDIKNGSFEPSIGAQSERAWSTGSRTPPRKSPWSVFGRSSEEKMKRPNPAVRKGTLASAIVASSLDWEKDKVAITGSAKLEVAFDHSASLENGPAGNSNFRQVTMDVQSKFPALMDHSFEFQLHWVGTGNGIAPPQRFAYLGGSGTIATMKLLEQGGDKLFYVSGLYLVPIHQLTLPIVGSPYVGLRYAAGAAGIGELPALVQNITPMIGVRFLRAEYSFDPSSKKSALSIGLSLSP